MSQQRQRLQSSSSRTTTTTNIRSRAPFRTRPGLPLLIVVYLCLILTLSVVRVYADEIPPPNGAHAIENFDLYYDGTECTVHNGECCSDMTSIPCQGWFCITGRCAALRCDYCSEDDDWFCGRVEGVTKNQGMACKHKAFREQPCNNRTMPCMGQLTCSASNNTCQFTPELWEEYQEEVKSRRITMAGMIVVLICMFLAMRYMLKNEEARRRQIWEPVDSSAEASILRRLAEDTQRRVAGGWGQISGSLVEGGNAASAAVGTAFSRIRDNVRSVTGGRGAMQPEDCDDDTMEMLPNGRRQQTRRELEADMRNFLLEADEEEDEDEGQGWSQSRDEDGLLARHRNSTLSPGSNTGLSPAPQTGGPSGGFPDEPPAYDTVRASGHGQSSIFAELSHSAETSTASEQQEQRPQAPRGAIP
ncbi:MAG: hypothetical protein J3Q66DRAFT_339615 [Benniella sp.]|nr:MAG: hypothetical protein J3Q66DRAFT_339615 [Benniella sp.]